MMRTPPTSATMLKSLATRPRRWAPSTSPCCRLFRDWGEVRRRQPSRNQVKELSRGDRQDPGTVVRGGKRVGEAGAEGTGQQGCVKHVFTSLPPEGVGQWWLRRGSPRERPEKAPDLGSEIHAERRGKAGLLLGFCPSAGRKLEATAGLGQGPVGLTMTA